MAFDWSLNIGTILTLGGVVFTAFAAWYSLKSDIRAVQDRLANTERDLLGQIKMNAQMIAEIAAVRQDVAVIRDRLEPPPMSAQNPSKGV